jgi:ComEC/Rec2-related protein
VLVRPPTGADAPGYGATIELSGTIQPPAASPPGALFDYRRYLWKQGIVDLVEAEDIRRTGTDGLRRWLVPLYHARARLAAALAEDMRDPEEGNILQAMALGYRRRLPDEVREDFVRSSTIHVFAISGLHVGIVALIGAWLLATLGVPTRVRGVVLILGVGVYVLMCGAAASAVRAWLMLACWWGARLLRRPRVPLNAIAAAALLSLLWQPLALLQTGFLFSFTVVTVLVVGWPLVTDRMRVLGERIWWLPPGLRQHRLGRWRMRPVWLLATSCLAWLGSAGMVAFVNGLLVPAGVLLNIGVVGLCPFILGFAAAKTTASLLGLGLLATWFARALSILVQALQAVGDLGQLPGASLRICPLPPLVAVVFYGLLALFLRRRQTGRLRLVTLALLLGVLLAPTAWHRAARPTSHVLAGDGGTMPALLLPSRYGLPPVVINTAGFEGSRRLAAVLEQEGVGGIEALVFSSGGWGVAGNAERFLRRWRPGTLVVPGNWQRSRALAAAVAAQRARGGRVRGLGAGSERTVRTAAWVLTVSGPVPQRTIRAACPTGEALTVSNSPPGILHVQAPGLEPARLRRRSNPVDVRIPSVRPPAGTGKD